jgi:quinol-cytochrome oxidoreductase complex cytochrome b subunit
MANAYSIIKIILMIFLIVVLVLMLVFFIQAVINISKSEHNRKPHINNAITFALIAANAALGLVGTYREHFLFTLIFAILQTVLIILGVFLSNELWFMIPWIGSAILAYVFAFMIRQGHTSA